VIARDLGVSRRTVTRHWRIVRDHLAEDISSAPPHRRMA
jgi:DNA-binding transcriptional ArsR family regulator